MLKFYNDLIKDKQDFIPIEEGIVKIYVCGPTVYDSPHIGHARAAVAFDILRRYLIFKGYKVTYASNYTDVDDKMIDRANNLGITIKELAQKYISEYEDIMNQLNVLPPDIRPKATESIEAIIDLNKLIIKNGYGYVSNGSLYFDVSKYEDYDSIFMRKQVKDRTETAMYQYYMGTDQDTKKADFADEKKSEKDFAIWKKAKEGEPTWDSPWGPGRPGWHIECSAMTYKHLGKEIDIHGGGKDLIFPHHTNEIAQTYAALGTKLARYWMHNGFVNINNEKMSKSLNNFFTVGDVLKNYDGIVLRLFLASVNYRTPINYTIDALNETKTVLQKIIDFYNTIKTFTTKAIKNEEKEKFNKELDSISLEFFNAMDDDLNTAEALSQIYRLIKFTNNWLLQDKKEIDDDLKERIMKILIDFSNIFGVIIDKSIQQLGVFGISTSGLDDLIQEKQNIISKLMETLIDVRNDLRKKKLFEVSDKIRDELKKIGIELNDMKGKTYWKYIEE